MNPVTETVTAVKSAFNPRAIVKVAVGLISFFIVADVIQMITGFSITSFVFNPVTYIRNKFNI